MYLTLSDYIVLGFLVVSAVVAVILMLRDNRPETEPEKSEETK